LFIRKRQIKKCIRFPICERLNKYDARPIGLDRNLDYNYNRLRRRTSHNEPFKRDDYNFLYKLEMMREYFG